MSATNGDVQVLSGIRCPRHGGFDFVHASAEIVFFSEIYENASLCLCLRLQCVCGFGDVCLL